MGSTLEQLCGNFFLVQIALSGDQKPADPNTPPAPNPPSPPLPWILSYSTHQEAGGDLLFRSIGNDVLHGGAGIDALKGAADIETFVASNSGFSMLEDGNQAIESLHAAIAHVLTANVQNLTSTAGMIDGTGNVLANVIIADQLANNIVGSAANTLDDCGDHFNGGRAMDTIAGRVTHDTYIVGNADANVLNGPVGNHTIYGPAVTDGGTAGTYCIAVSLGAGHETLTGVASNLLTGTPGGDACKSWTGHDTGVSGNGTVTFAVRADDDSFAFTPDADHNTVTGGAFNSLAGRTGSDAFNGWSDHASVAVGGSPVMFTIGADGDTFAFTAAVGHTLTGGAFNSLTGGTVTLAVAAGDDMFVFRTGVGHDTLDGWTGNETVYRAASNDTFVSTAGAGHDTLTDRAVDGTFAVTIGTGRTANDDHVSLTGLDIDSVANALAYTVHDASAHATIIDNDSKTDPHTATLVHFTAADFILVS
jgi:serralysin